MAKVHKALMHCPECGLSAEMETTWTPELFQEGPDSDPNNQLLAISIPIRKCRGCGFQFTDQVAEELQDALVKAYRADMANHEET